MKFKPKNDTCGVPCKGFINAKDYSQEDENALIERAKRRGIDLNVFMMGAGFVPVAPQLEVFPDESMDEVKPKRTRKAKEEIQEVSE